MKILQITNIPSHHQIPLAKELCRIVGKENFLFAAMQPLDRERLLNGWQGDFPEPWIIYPNENDEHKAIYDEYWEKADIVLCGERLIDEMQRRVDKGKLCFYMSERWWKPPIGKLRLIHPRYLKMFLKFRKLSKSELFHYLATGPVAARDLYFLKSLRNRTWQWGYFTSKPGSDLGNINIKMKSNQPLQILWMGRMLKWKQVSLIIHALHKLKLLGHKNFHLTLVGDGPERKRLEQLANKLLEDNSFTFVNFIKSSDVHSLMAMHDIYILSSNGYEGWGAVVNEAMSVGCAVIASDCTGSAASMIKHGQNGLLFNSKSAESLATNIELLITNPQLTTMMGQNAILSFNNHWLPSIAAERLVKLADSLNNNAGINHYSDGPLSKFTF